MWNLGGLAIAVSIAALAWYRSRRTGGFYDADVYGMTAITHRRYTLTSLAFACFFAAAFVLHLDAAGVAGLALYAVIAIFYAASFLRGADDYHE